MPQRQNVAQLWTGQQEQAYLCSMDPEPKKMRSFRGCRHCKHAKRRCSEDRPTCSACAKARRRCVYDTDALFRFSVFEPLGPPTLSQKRKLDEHKAEVRAQEDPEAAKRAKQRHRNDVFVKQNVLPKNIVTARRSTRRASKSEDQTDEQKHKASEDMGTAPGGSVGTERPVKREKESPKPTAISALVS